MELSNLGTPELAYLGDSVFELWVRTRLVQHGVCGSGNLNAMARGYVTASAQAEAAKKILHLLTEKEESVLKRARNYKVGNVPKSASAAQYHLATGLEALLAYLYLEGEQDRIYFLLENAFGNTEL